MKKIVFLVLISFGYLSQAGELVYRDGFGGAGCEVSEQFPLSSGIRGSFRDTTKTEYTLACMGRKISVVTMPSIICPPRGGGCYRPSLVTCGPRSCVSNLARVNDTTNYEFNYDLAGVNEVIFGTVSKKSPSNAFSPRTETKNYLVFSNDGILDKAVILAEGYDPQNQTFPQYYYGYGFYQLVNSGRDLIVVNFPKGDDSIVNNAAVLEKIIMEINGAKQGNTPTAVIGYSMGGIVARYALKSMENRGVDHKTSVYVSFDSPHMGANFPLAIEETIEELYDEVMSVDEVVSSSDVRRARNIYKSSAASSMLLSGANFRPATISDFPNKLVRIGVTSGSLLGSNGLMDNSVSEGEIVAAFKYYLYDNWIGKWSEDFVWYSKRRANEYYDNVPGSYELQFWNAYYELKAAADSFDDDKDDGVDIEEKKVTFIPTVSALAMTSLPTTYLRDIFRNYSPFDYYIAAEDSSADKCLIFNNQNSDGKNLVHHPVSESFNYSQLQQINCALNRFQILNPVIPDRTHKQI
jgi:PGAP1-like protein